MSEQPKCTICGEPMPPGEEMFKYHGFSGDCPKPPLPRPPTDTERMDWMERNLCRAGEVRNATGQCVKLARTWAIMGELDTLRETIDAAMSANAN